MLVTDGIADNSNTSIMTIGIDSKEFATIPNKTGEAIAKTNCSRVNFPWRIIERFFLKKAPKVEHLLLPKRQGKQ